MSQSRFRMLPPSAAPLHPRDILAGLRALGNPEEAVEGLRAAIRERFGVRHIFLATSGRAGLSAGLRALHRLAPERDEVLLPAYTSFSVPSAVVNAGLKVSLYDLQADTLAPDMESLEQAMGPRTLCVVACHLFGYPVELKPIEILCRQHGAALFDDAAQAMGASIGGRLAGTMGDVGLFSLSRGKNMTSVDGGIVLTDCDEVAEGLSACLENKRDRFILVRDMLNAVALTVLMHPNAYWLPASLPFLNIGASIFDPKFDIEVLAPFRAAMAVSVLKRLDDMNFGRRQVASKLLKFLSDAEFVRFIHPLPEAEPVFLRLPLLPKSANWPNQLVPEHSVLGIVRSYPLVLHEISGLKPHLSKEVNKFPGATYLASNILTFPTHVFVNDDYLNLIKKYLYSDHI